MIVVRNLELKSKRTGKVFQLCMGSVVQVELRHIGYITGSVVGYRVESGELVNLLLDTWLIKGLHLDGEYIEDIQAVDK